MKDSSGRDWWLDKMEQDPQWVARRDQVIEDARICRETKSWLVGNEVFDDGQ